MSARAQVGLGYTVSADEACRRLGVSPTGLARMVQAGLVRAALPARWGRGPDFADVRMREVDVARLAGSREAARFIGPPGGLNTERAMALGAIMRGLNI